MGMKVNGTSGLTFPDTTTLASAGQSSVRAWVNFNGTGTVAIRAAFNVTSITDNGTGIYVVNFTTALPDTSYSITASSSVHSGVQDFVSVQVGSVMSTTSTGIRTYSSGGIYDPATVCIAIFR